LRAIASFGSTLRKIGSASSSSVNCWSLTSFSKHTRSRRLRRQPKTLRLEQTHGERRTAMVRPAELIARSPDVAVTFTNFALEVLKPIAGSVPIVFIGVGDPVGSGFVASLAYPGGNITGFASHEPSMGGKWLEVLKETAPQITRVLAIVERENPSFQSERSSFQKALILKLYSHAASSKKAVTIRVCLV
jgi:ABC-type uncharacterized transport system substrate-binding protein